MTEIPNNLRSLAWYRTSVRLRNIRNEHAKTHPLNVFRGVFYSASEKLIVQPVSTPLGKRIRKGTLYDIHLVSVNPAVGPAEIEAYFSKFAPENFEVVERGAVERRTLATVLEELTRSLDMDSPEVCADFLSPLPAPEKSANKQENPGKKENLRTRMAAGFFEALELRIKELTGSAPPDSLPKLACLPYFWRREQAKMKSSSNDKKTYYLDGMEGPFYLRGDWQAWLPWLALGSELQLGAGSFRICGAGRFVLKTDRTFFDRQLNDMTRYLSVWEDAAEEAGPDDPPPGGTMGGEVWAMEAASRVATRRWQPCPVAAVRLPKGDGGARVIAVLEPEDRIIHRTLHDILQSSFEVMFEEASVGFRQGISAKTARQKIVEALDQGCTHVLKSDVAEFFDQIDWSLLGSTLDRHLPLPDTATRVALHACMRTPWQTGSRMPERVRGILQGSPLSPLLANLYLDGFDEKITEAGFNLVRYGDDFVILTESAERARQALVLVRECLTALKLEIKNEKTFIREVQTGFRFLGQDISPEQEEEWVEADWLRPPLYVIEPGAWLSLDGESVVVRRQGAMIRRLPLYRVGEIILMGAGGLSAKLAAVCAKRRIPVSFCSGGGWYHSTLRPDSKRHFEAAGRHFQRLHGLDEAELTEIARDLLAAKIDNHIVYLEGRPECRGRLALRVLAKIRDAKLHTASDVATLRGFEGEAGKVAFHEINRLVAARNFSSEGRLAHQKPDAWNCLLDFLYSQLFTRINVLLRSRGLNPYLGFLHSPLDHYESLVSDLQEPFRPRIDQFAVDCVNQGRVRSDHFPKDQTGRHQILPEARRTLLLAFQQYLGATPRAAGDLSLQRWIHGQVDSIHRWVHYGTKLHFHHSRRKRLKQGEKPSST